MPYIVDDDARLGSISRRPEALSRDHSMTLSPLYSGTSTPFAAMAFAQERKNGQGLGLHSQGESMQPDYHFIPDKLLDQFLHRPSHPLVEGESHYATGWVPDEMGGIAHSQDWTACFWCMQSLCIYREFG